MRWYKHPYQKLSVVIRGNINPERYLNEVLAIQDIPLFQQNAVSIFQQENAHPHAARNCRYYLKTNKIIVLLWPAPQPNLSLIELIFGRHVKARQAETIEMLSNYLTDFWNAIMQETIHNLIIFVNEK